MTYSISFLPDIEELLVKDLRTYLHEICKFPSLFPNYKTVRVTQTHPFAEFLDQELTGMKVPMGLLSSVTVTSVSDAKAGEYPVVYDPGSLVLSDLDEASGDSYVYSTEDFSAIKTLLTGHPTVASKSVSTIRRHQCTFSIWTDNLVVKNRIYDQSQMFLAGWGRLKLEAELGIKIADNEVQGQRSGMYNYDFGRVLYGGEISVPIDVPYYQVLVDEVVLTDPQIQLIVNGGRVG